MSDAMIDFDTLIRPYISFILIVDTNPVMIFGPIFSILNEVFIGSLLA